MNAERLHAICLALQKEINQINIQNKQLNRSCPKIPRKFPLQMHCKNRKRLGKLLMESSVTTKRRARNFSHI